MMGIEAAIGLCGDAGIAVDKARVIDHIVTFMALIKEWNRYASLVSVGDADHALPVHCVDSLSLAPSVASLRNKGDYRYLDIGTGGGFPAIPLCILFPQLETVLIERNTKKTVFLKKVIRRLSLERVTVLNTSFESQHIPEESTVYTSRAIEKPQVMIPQIVESLRPGDVYFCQSEDVEQIVASQFPRHRHEVVADAFSLSGMRRNRMHQIMVDG